MMNNTSTFIKKEFLHVFRDRKTLLMLFGLPIVQIILFGFALTNEITNAKIVVCDYAKDDASQQIIGKLQASQQFDIQRILLNHNRLKQRLKKGKQQWGLFFRLISIVIYCICIRRRCS